MHEPYRMVFISCLASLILLIGILIWKFVYPKKNINFFVLLLLVSILPIISIFRPGDYESGDFNIHVYRTITFYNALKDGAVMPSWAGNLNATYGYPLFIFLNPLPYYLQSFLHWLGNSYIESLKLLLAMSYISSGVFFYFWAKKEVKKNFAAFAGAVVYLFTPYHLVDLHFRVDIGEILVFSFLPLFLYCFRIFMEKRNIIWLIISGIIYSLIMLSHQALAVFTLLLIIPYAFYYALKTKNAVRSLALYSLPIALGFAYSSYTWIPHLIYPKYTLAYLLSNQELFFPKLTDLLYSPWKYGFLFQGPKGELSYLIGYTQLLLILGSLFFLLRKKVNKSIVAPYSLWLFLSIFLIFMITNYSSWLWKIFPILGTTQFSTRLLLVVVFSLSAVMVYLSIVFKKFSLLLIIFITTTIAYTIPNWGHRNIAPAINDSYLIENLPKSTAQGEGLALMATPKWILPYKGFMNEVPKNHLQILEGSGELNETHRTETTHTYISFSQKPLTVQDNTWYFPGWKLFIDGKQEQINITKNNNPGMISFSIPSGLHKIDLTYQDLSELFIIKIVCVIGYFISLLWLLFLWLKNRFKKNKSSNNFNH